MTNEELAEKLRIIATSTYSEDIHGTKGLCRVASTYRTTFLDINYSQSQLIDRLITKWSIKYGTGSSLFPVPSFSKLGTGYTKFLKTDGKQKWSKHTKYGRARRHMCNFVADVIEAECPGEGLCASPGCPVHYSD